MVYLYNDIYSEDIPLWSETLEIVVAVCQLKYHMQSMELYSPGTHYIREKERQKEKDE